jgi:hypothetical protein
MNIISKSIELIRRCIFDDKITGASVLQYITSCIIIWKNIMLTSRQLSQHKLKQNLHDSLRKEQELANRINVLMADK